MSDPIQAVGPWTVVMGDGTEVELGAWATVTGDGTGQALPPILSYNPDDDLIVSGLELSESERSMIVYRLRDLIAAFPDGCSDRFCQPLDDTTLDESHAMTIDELLPEIDRVLEDYRNG